MRWFLTTALSVAALTLLCGCPPKPSGTGGHAGHGDEEKAPHGGQLFATPDHKLHVELVIDKKATKADVYLLDGKAKNAVPTKAETLTLTLTGTPPKTVTFKSEPQKDDPMGQSSHFTATDPLFADDLQDPKISVMINDKPYIFTPE